jgi:simple sugar transport system permease protein
VASGLCAALAGIVATADIRGADANNAGLWLELDAILAVVIGGNSLLGGRFSIAASVLGALIIQTVDTGILLAGFPSEYNLVIKAGLVLIILVVQSPNLALHWYALRRAIRSRRETALASAKETG